MSDIIQGILRQQVLIKCKFRDSSCGSALVVPRAQNQGLSAEVILQKVQPFRNVVVEIVAVLEAVKPIRPAPTARCFPQPMSSCSRCDRHPREAMRRVIRQL